MNIIWIKQITAGYGGANSLLVGVRQEHVLALKARWENKRSLVGV